MRAVLAAQAFGERLTERFRPTSSAPLAQLTAGVGDDEEFPWLDEAPGTEVVTGAIGRFWERDVPLVRVLPGEFDAFAEPGYAKMVWSLQVHPRTGGGSWIGIELRADATDDEGWSNFATYWSSLENRSRVLRRTALRSFASKLGSPPAESSRRLAGDDLIPHASSNRTHAVTIEAPPDTVWPWLVQMGCGRAGWYSLDRLHNGGIRSRTGVRDALQQAKIGDLFSTSTRAGDDLAVLHIEPNRSLVLGTPHLLHHPAAASPPREPDDTPVTWAFVLDPIGDVATRLLVRLRVDEPADPLTAIARPLTMAEHEVMQRVQLRNLKWRAEALWRSRELMRREGAH
jgi:hypothetical protein